MRREEQIELPFVQDDQGALRWVSDLVGTSAEEQARLRCPGCQQPVRLHLRDAGRPHATHLDPLAGFQCLPPLTTLEREAARVHLRDELRRARSLAVVRTCAKCRSRREVELARSWDEVDVGQPLETRAPDVLVTRKGEPVVAIEVFTSPELSAARVAELDWRRMPWIQVRAREVLDPPWRADIALRADRLPGGAWTCPGCAAKRGRQVELELLAGADPDGDDLLDAGHRRIGRQSSSYRLSRRVRTRYAPAGTLALLPAPGTVVPSQEHFAHVGLERIVEVDVSEELVRIHFSLAAWGTAGGQEVLALTYRMMEGEQLSNPRPLATEPLAARPDPASWRALMERAQQALASPRTPGVVTFDSGWKVERSGCGCPICVAGHASPPPFLGRREPQLDLFPDEFVGMADEIPDDLEPG